MDHRPGDVMRRGVSRARGLAAIVLAAGLTGLWGGTVVEGAEPGTWTWGVGLGVLGNTPDGTAFAFNANGEAFVLPFMSVGPLLQLGFTGDSAQIGLSGQLKFWIEIPGTDKRLKLTPQVGVGFVHNTFRSDDTSWLVPLGLGVDYAVSNNLAVTGTLLLNFTDLDTGRGSGADFMPGFTIGVRF